MEYVLKNKVQHTCFLLSLIILLFNPNAQAQTLWENPPVNLPKNVQELIQKEIKINPGASPSRTHLPLKIFHFEIPLSYIEADIAKNIRPEIRASLIFEKNGQKFLRWILNPEDALHKQLIAAEIHSLTGHSPKILQHYVGYLTSSRSIIVQDPASKAIFSVKASTNVTGGNWSDKKMTDKAVRISRAYSDYISQHQASDKLQSFKHIPEPAGFILNGSTYGFTIRDMEIFHNKDIGLIPFFSALANRWGAHYAIDRTHVGPSIFWKEHLFTPWGRALAEGITHYGFYPNSAHAQDFLLEVDKNGKLNGKVHMRDIMDSHAEITTLKARGASELIQLYAQGYEKINLVSGGSASGNSTIDAFLGMEKPMWLQGEVKTFWSAFDQRFNELTGLLRNRGSAKLNSEPYKEFLNKLKRGASCKSSLE